MPLSFDQRNYIQSKDTEPQKAFLDYPFSLSFSSQSAEGVKLFLDMDGVLTDFTKACEKLDDNMMLWYNSDKKRFWKQITAAGTEFWSEMPWMTGGRDLHLFLNSSGCCPTILSALPNPGRGRALVNARKGKIQWLRKELGSSYAENAILCFRPEKALQSGSARVLIDDNSENIREWEEAGGIGILHKNAGRTIRCFGKVLKTENKI